MASVFPNALDSLATNKANTTQLPNDHPTHHNDLADAVNKIEAELGLTPSDRFATVKARLDGLAFNVKDAPYNAVGDGVANDTTAIQAALNAGVGKNVYVPAGTYLTDILTFPGADTTLYGPGTLKMLSSSSAKVILQTSSSTPQARIHGLTFDLNALVNSVAIQVVSSVNPTIQNCRFKNGGTAGVFLLTAFRDVLIEGNLFEDCGYGVLTSDAASLTGSGIIVRGNRFYRCQFDGVELNGPSGTMKGAVVVGNHFQEVGTADSVSSGFGVGADGCDDIVIANNRFLDTYRQDIHIEDDCSDVVISGNISRTCGRLGTGTLRSSIYTTTATAISRRVSITGNVVDGASDRGIFAGSAASGLKDLTIIGNTVRGCGAEGIKVGSTQEEGVISGNVCVDNTGPGIILNGRNFVVSNNRCYDTGAGVQTYGIQVQSAQYCLVSNNNFRGNVTDAVNDLGSNTGVVFRDNLGIDMPTVASATTITVPNGAAVISVTGTTTITGVTAGYAGQLVTLVFTGILTFTDGGNLKIAGNFVTTNEDSITLVCNGANWMEVARSVN